MADIPPELESGQPTIEPYLPKNKRATLKGAFQAIYSRGDYKDGIRQFTKVTGKFLYFCFQGGLGRAPWDALRNPHLSMREKIIPALGMGLGLVTGIAALIVLTLGVPLVSPYFLLASSIGGVAKSVGMFIEEYIERNKHRKALTSEKDLQKQIDKKLAPEEKAIVNKYVSKAPPYAALYALRKNIIEGDASPQDKQRMVKQFNTTIENLHQGIYTPLTGNEKIDQELKNYANAAQAFTKIKENLPASIVKSIEQYKTVRETIYSQDLPENTKKNIMATIEGKKIKEDDLKLLYATIGNHHLKTTTEEPWKSFPSPLLKKEVLPSGKVEDRYSDIFSLIKRTERLHYLEKSVPRRGGEIVGHIGAFILSIGAIIVVPLIIASPAAPAAVIASGLLTAAGAAFTGVSLFDSGLLAANEANRKEKIKGTKKELSGAVDEALLSKLKDDIQEANALAPAAKKAEDENPAPYPMENPEYKEDPKKSEEPQEVNNTGEHTHIHPR